MTRIITLGLLLLTLTGCAAPKAELTAPVPAPVAEPMAAPAALSTDACQSGDDGIGGTGCPVE